MPKKTTYIEPRNFGTILGSMEFVQQMYQQQSVMPNNIKDIKETSF